MDSKDREIAELKAMVAALTKRVAELELALAKANKDSSTSSKPPSSDITKPKPKPKKGPGRRKKRGIGGQLGRQRTLREPLPEERVDETIDYPDKPTQAWAAQLLDRSRRLFSAWHRRDEMTTEGFRRSMITHRDRFLELVRHPSSTKEAKNLAARFAIVQYVDGDSKDLHEYDLSQDYFRFMFTDGVEPTNNHNEQQIRHCVIDRRITQGTRGEAGQRYHERMWTAIATCKKQNRSFFSFLLKSITAKLNGQAAPTLLGA